MKNKGLKFKSITLVMLIVALLQVEAKAYGEAYVNNAITIDGYYDDWKDKPHTDITWSFKLKVVHKVALFRDNKNVYLHVKMSETNYTQFNGYEYRFIYDGTEVVFAAVYDNGNIKKLGNGIYKLTVRTQQNYIPVSTGYLTRKSGESDSAEIVIPISAFGNGINLEGVKTIEFYSPNLGPQHVICTGTSSGPYIAVGLGFIIVCVGYLNFKKKRKKA